MTSDSQQVVTEYALRALHAVLFVFLLDHSRPGKAYAEQMCVPANLVDGLVPSSSLQSTV